VHPWGWFLLAAECALPRRSRSSARLLATQLPLGTRAMVFTYKLQETTHN